MKLKTSFFNMTALKKDITRFAPVWGLYTVFMLLTLFLITADSSEPVWFASAAPEIMMAMGIVNFVYGGLCALLLFGDLFSSKMCNALHAMPLRREGWFLTHLSAGFLFCVVPNSLGAIFAAIYLQEYSYLAMIWLALMICQYLFFFGVGAFSAQCAGNRLGAIAVYGLFNFLAVLAAFLINTFYAPVLYGIKPNLEKLSSYSPVVGFTMSEYITVTHRTSTAVFEGFIPEDWRFLFLSLAVGLALLGAAVLLYRKRQMESAGDFIAVKAVAPVFLIIYTLCVGAVLYYIADMIGNGTEYVFLVIGFAIGFFTGWMLLEKKVNVFKLKKFVGFGALTLLFFLTITITWLDPIGITRYVPQAEQVKSVAISPNTSDYYLENRAQVLTDPGDITAVLRVHSDLVKHRTTSKNNRTCLRLRYTLRNGMTVDRLYYIDADSEHAAVLNEFLSDFRFITHKESVEDLLSNTYSIKFSSHYNMYPNFTISYEKLEDYDAEKYPDEDNFLHFPVEGAFNNHPVSRGLMDAVYLDCKAGTMTQLWAFHKSESIGTLTIDCMLDSYRIEHVNITVYSDSANTVQYLKTLAAK